MPATSRTIEKVRRPLLVFVDDVGDGTGDNDFAKNFLEPTVYQRIANTGFTFCITAIVVNFIGSGGISPSGFGGGSALPNGMTLRFFIGGMLFNVGQIEFIKTNYGLSLTTTLTYITEFTGNDKGYRAELDITKLGVECVSLNGDNGDAFQVVFDDDYTSRISIGTIAIEGYVVSNS